MGTMKISPAEKRGKLDVMFLEIAQKMASQSHCARVQVGMVLVRDGRIQSTGWNGTPSNYINCCDYHHNDLREMSHDEFKVHHRLFSKFEIHAEINGIAYAARQGVETADCTAYITHSPCMDCAKAMIAAGIKRVVFAEIYDRCDEAIDFLKDCKVEVIRKRI